MNTITINLSLPKELLNAVDRLAKREARSRSELFREAARVYIRRVMAWDEIYKIGRRKAKELGIKSEEDVYRMIEEFRAEERAKEKNESMEKFTTPCI